MPLPQTASKTSSKPSIMGDNTERINIKEVTSCWIHFYPSALLLFVLWKCTSLTLRLERTTNCSVSSVQMLHLLSLETLETFARIPIWHLHTDADQVMIPFSTFSFLSRLYFGAFELWAGKWATPFWHRSIYRTQTNLGWNKSGAGGEICFIYSNMYTAH